MFRTIQYCHCSPKKATLQFHINFDTFDTPPDIQTIILSLFTNTKLIVPTCVLTTPRSCELENRASSRILTRIVWPVKQIVCQLCVFFLSRPLPSRPLRTIFCPRDLWESNLWRFCTHFLPLRPLRTQSLAFLRLDYLICMPMQLRVSNPVLNCYRFPVCGFGAIVTTLLYFTPLRHRMSKCSLGFQRFPWHCNVLDFMPFWYHPIFTIVSTYPDLQHTSCLECFYIISKSTLVKKQPLIWNLSHMKWNVSCHSTCLRFQRLC